MVTSYKGMIEGYKKTIKGLEEWPKVTNGCWMGTKGLHMGIKRQ